MTITMYDTVDVGTVPPNPEAVAGYVAGNWPTYNSLVQRFPNAHHLSIAVQADERARCLDVENGDATNSQAPGWFKSLADHSQGKPIVYTFASNCQALINTLSGAGVGRSEYLLWSAHWTYRAHICAPGVCGYPAADLTQWTDKALGRNLDESLVNDYVFGPPPPPPDPHHYLWFQTGPFPTKKWGNLNERLIVEQYDGARRRPVRYFLYLKFNLRPKLKFLADRVAHEALYDDHTGKKRAKADWATANRGWRFQELIHRSQGKQVVK